MALVIGAMCVSCGTKPEPPKPQGDYPELTASEEGKIVIAVKFAVTPCNDVVFAGSYNGWYGTGAGDDVTQMAKFAPVVIEGESWPGWYYVEVNAVDVGRDQEGDCGTYHVVVEGKPVQLTDDGKFDWAYQIGCKKEGDCEVSGVTVKTGDVTVVPGYPGECDIHITSTDYVAIIFSQWKSDPCVPKNEAGTATFNVTVPASTPLDAYVSIAGNFDVDAWSPGVYVMTNNGNRTYTFTMDVPAECLYKYIVSADNVLWDWAYNEDFEGGNREMPASLIANDVVDSWASEPWAE